MAVYSDIEIKRARKRGQIVIHPYLEENVRGSSVDVTLGEWYYATERSEIRTTYNPFDDKEVTRYFGEPQRAIIHEDWCRSNNHTLFVGIPAEHPIIVLRPGERILAHTHEFIGINPPGTTEMRARSSWGRNGIASCFDAGWGDPGYVNRWTMEIYNLNRHASVPLPVGERIAQIVFHHTAEVDRSYGLGGKYQGGHRVDEIVASWRPDMMLPRAYQDHRHHPAEL